MTLVLATAQELDAQDPLAAFRERFVITEPDLIYLDGNSLGRLPKASAELAEKLVGHQWGQRLIRSWGEGWMDKPSAIGDKLGKLLGAGPGEVVIADSTSVNLFKLVVAALRRQAGRSKIITDDLNFPSDLYILQGAVGLLGLGHQLEVVPSPDDIHGPVEEIIKKLDEDTALLTLSHTVFKSGYTYDMAAVTQAAREKGVLVLWDLSHSAGAVPVDLNAAGAELAIGCTYKYLNGGPGSPAFLYIAKDLQKALENPITGWWGQRGMFDFDLEYQADASLKKFLTGTAPLLSLALIEPGVDVLLEAGVERVRAKSLRQTDFMIQLWGEFLKGNGYTLNSPPDPERRGSHISIGHEEGLRIDKALIQEMNVIPDFRAPDNIRFGFAPLYTTYTEIFQAVIRLHRIVQEGIYKKYDSIAPQVT